VVGDEWLPCALSWVSLEADNCLHESLVTEFTPKFCAEMRTAQCRWPWCAAKPQGTGLELYATEGLSRSQPPALIVGLGFQHGKHRS